MKPAVQAILYALFSAMPASGLCAAAKPVAESDGKAILQSQCGRCHSIEKMEMAPIENVIKNLGTYRRYPIERLEFELSEGVGSRHRAMPQIQFSSEQIDKILKYLKSITNTN